MREEKLRWGEEEQAPCVLKFSSQKVVPYLLFFFPWGGPLFYLMFSPLPSQGLLMWRSNASEEEVIGSRTLSLWSVYRELPFRET